MKHQCTLEQQGFSPGRCGTRGEGISGPACELTYRQVDGVPFRRIVAADLSRPEHYFSIYQSGCTMDCAKCHSWRFSQHVDGKWYTPDDILQEARLYNAAVTVQEPRARATAFHASDLCRGCGTCVEIHWIPYDPGHSFREGIYLEPTGRRGSRCPHRLHPDQLTMSPQGIGPARNIVAFTGGDLACRPDFLARCAEKIKGSNLNLWILHETNGFGLIPAHLDQLRQAGIDSFWLDIKAYDEDIHRRLTGVDNDWILRLPEEIRNRDFVLEVLSLYIPGWVEEDQLAQIARRVAAVDPDIPFTILAFFPAHRMKGVPPPTLAQMLAAHEAVTEAGLRQVRLGNLGVFVHTDADYDLLMARAARAV
jgi:pyruvate-formate lyase-activating enzyme